MSHIHIDMDVIKRYDSNTIMGKTTSATRHLSRILEQPHTSLTVSQALAAAYSSTDLPKTSMTKPKKGLKPWVKREKAKAPGTKLRRKLLTLKSLEERHLEFKPEVPSKVGLRLERTMGTPMLKLFDHRYMNKLSEKIKYLDQVEIKERIEKRKKVEIQRRRQLVIDGKAEPEAGEESLLLHPVLRCKRAMERVNKATVGISAVVGGIPVPFQPKLKKLTLVEPFDGYERTGVLFTEHKDHYLRVKRVTGESAKSDFEDYQSSFRVPSFLRQSTGSNKSKKQAGFSLLNIQGKSRDKLQASRSVAQLRRISSLVSEDAARLSSAGADETNEEGSGSVPEMNLGEGEEESTAIGSNSDVDSDRSSVSYKEEGPADGKKDCGVSAMSALNQRDGTTIDDIEKLYRKVRSKLVDEVFKENQEVSASIFDVGANVIQAYKRGQAKADHFCKTTHRRKFEASQKE